MENPSDLRFTFDDLTTLKLLRENNYDKFIGAVRTRTDVKFFTHYGRLNNVIRYLKAKNIEFIYVEFFTKNDQTFAYNEAMKATFDPMI